MFLVATQATMVQENGSLENSPPLPNVTTPSQPSSLQFDSDDLDKLPPLPPGSPPPISGISDVPLRNYTFFINILLLFFLSFFF